MKNAYEMLFVDREEINRLDRESPEKADKLIRERLEQTRIFIYGNPKGSITNSYRRIPKIRQMHTFKKLQELMSLDIGLIIAYDKIRTKSKRKEYSEKLRREESCPIDTLRIDEIQLQVSHYINSSLNERNERSINAYNLVDVLEPENEETWSEDKSKELDKKIFNRYNILKERYEQEIRARIHRDEFDKESLIKDSLMQLKLKWAYDKIKSRESRRQYRMYKEYSLSKKQLDRMKFYADKQYSEKDFQNGKKYIIDCDNDQFYLRPVTSKEDEDTALEQGKTVIHKTKRIAYKQDLGVVSEIEEYGIEKMEKGQIKTNYITTDSLNISVMTKSVINGKVVDGEYANFVLGKMFSDYSIDACIQYRFGFIGRPNKSKDGAYNQYFEEEVMQFAKQLREKYRVWGE